MKGIAILLLCAISSGAYAAAPPDMAQYQLAALSAELSECMNRRVGTEAHVLELEAENASLKKQLAAITAPAAPTAPATSTLTPVAPTPTP